MKRIVVIGSLNMDFAVRMPELPQKGETVICETMRLSPGGKGANQAYACAAVGGDTSMIGCVGRDSYGDSLLESLRLPGVRVSAIRRTQEAGTGVALINIDSRGENNIVVVQGANNFLSRKDIDDNAALLRGADMVVLQCEVPIDTVVYAAKTVHGMGKPVVLDPAPAPKPFPVEILPYLTLIKPNEHEAAQITGLPEGDAHVEAAAEKLLAMGAKNVVVTLGAKGAFVCAQDGTRELLGVEDVPVTDTTAAGDSFTAAVAVRLAEGATLKDAVAFGNKVGTIVVQRQGGQTSIPLPDEMQRLLGGRG